MKMFFNILMVGLLAILGAGCASDPHFYPQTSTYGTASSVSVQTPNVPEGTDILSSSGRISTRVPQEEVLKVSWDLIRYPSYGYGNQRPSERKNCRVFIKPATSLNYVEYPCSEIEKVDRDYFVHFWYNDNPVSINLRSIPGGFVYNGGCDRWFTPTTRYTERSRVVWQSHTTVHGGNPIRREVGCRPGQG